MEHHPKSKVGTREGFSVLSRAVKVSLGMREHLTKDQREEKMSHRFFQIRIGTEATAEMIQDLPISGNLVTVIQKGSAFGQEKEENRRGRESHTNREEEKKPEEHSKDSL